MHLAAPGQVRDARARGPRRPGGVRTRARARLPSPSVTDRREPHRMGICLGDLVVHGLDREMTEVTSVGTLGQSTRTEWVVENFDYRTGKRYRVPGRRERSSGAVIKRRSPRFSGDRRPTIPIKTRPGGTDSLPRAAGRSTRRRASRSGSGWGTPLWTTTAMPLRWRSPATCAWAVAMRTSATRPQPRSAADFSRSRLAAGDRDLSCDQYAVSRHYVGDRRSRAASMASFGRPQTPINPRSRPGARRGQLVGLG